MRLLVISPDCNLFSALENLLPRLSGLSAVSLLDTYPSPEQLAEELRTKRPAVVLVGLSDAEPALRAIELIHAQHPEVLTISANTVNSPELILTSLRAGAFEYFGPPFEAEQLVRVFKRADGGRINVQPKGRLIVFLPAHGGSGASTAALHVADAISRLGGGKVLLMDFDSHSGALEFRTQLKTEFNLADALRRDGGLDQHVWRRLAARWRGIEVLAPPSESFLPPEIYQRMSFVLESARDVYSWVIADLPPAIYTSCLDVLGQAESVYLVCTPEPVSLHLAHRRSRELRRLGLAKGSLKLIVNRITPEHRLKPEEVQELVEIPVAWSLRNDYRGLAQATMSGLPVAQTSQLGQQFTGLARQIIGVGDPEPDRSTGWSKMVSSVGRVFSRSSVEEESSRPAPVGSAAD